MKNDEKNERKGKKPKATKLGKSEKCWLRVIETRVVEVVTDGGRQQYGQVVNAEEGIQLANVYQAVHHLRHAEAVPEIMERIVAVILLHHQLEGAVNLISHLINPLLIT